MTKKKDEKFKIGDAAAQSDEVNIGFLLDMSGSMMSVKTATISGFNEYIQTMKAKSPNAWFTLMVFSSIEIREVFTDVAIKDVPELTDALYVPSGGTPLYDSVAYIIRTMSKRMESKANKNTLLNIMTDGEENESKEYSRDAIKKLIGEKEAEGWVVSYMGANQDSWAVARSIGVKVSNSLNYDANNMRGVFSKAADASALYTASRGVMKHGLFNNMVDDVDDVDAVSNLSGTNKTGSK